MSETIRVGVHGAGGAMAACVANAIDVTADLELVAAVGRGAAGTRLGAGQIEVARELRAFADAGCHVVVDFSSAPSARVALPWLAMHGMHAVSGTSGLDEGDVAAIRSAFGDGPAHCLIAPNFAISAVLLMRLCEIAAPLFDTAEVIEYHHDRKIDAPSGTAVATASRIAAARGEVAWHPDPTVHELVSGARGGTTDGVRVHSVRMRGMVAHQDVIFGAQGQTLTIRQDSYDRQSYMPGVVLACRRIADHPGLVIGLDAFL